MVVGHRTVLAQQAMDASDVIHMTFRKRVVGHSPPRKLLVQVPDGPSTDGGKRARQSITLAPESGDGAAVMCGWLDVGRKEAELRGYEMVAAQYATRFGRPFEVSVQEYGELMQDLQRTLYNLSVETRFAQGVPAAKPASVTRGPVPDAGRGRWLAYTLLGVALAVAAAALYFVML